MAPSIYFYLPDKVPADMPLSPEVYWPEYIHYMRGGVYAWIVQTFQRLRAAGFPCELTDRVPAQGILVAHRKSLPRDFIPPEKLLFVCVRADATFHPFAHLHVVENRRSLSHWYRAVHIPHWPQPWLLPRDPVRGDRWENACFIGEKACISQEMQDGAWEATLRELELSWQTPGLEKWHDYREADVVVAVRSFDGQRYPHKPASKLFNAWHAGVPAVLGRESAYQAERRSELDYLEVGSLAEVVAALRKLKADPALRRAMSANGRERAKESAPAVITARWREFFETVAIPTHDAWHQTAPSKHRFLRWNGWLKTKAQDWRERLGP
jgi:hypothetical protein